jgi:hypothetical protein
MVVNQVSYSYKSTATILRIDGNSGCGLMFYETELSIAPPQIRGTYVGSKDGQNILPYFLCFVIKQPPVNQAITGGCLCA